MKILISGGKGSLARALTGIASALRFEVVSLAKADMDVSDLASITSAIECVRPDIFIHAGAFTKPMVLHDQWRSVSIRNNVVGTANVALACSYYPQIRLVFISTDYVYSGTNGPYKEDSPLKPINTYAMSKLAGECAVQMVPRSVIMRCSFTERPFPHDSAFIDSYKSFLYVEEIAPLMLRILMAKPPFAGVVNVGGPRMTVFDFAKSSRQDVGKIRRQDIGSWVPYDTSLDTTLMHKILGSI